MLPREFVASRIYESFADYASWQLKAADGRLALCAFRALPANTNKSLPVDSKIYGALKPYLQKYFFGKCAYCESQFDHVAYGDVEHYRPKRQVEECAGHPGYYWLAYAEENLLPSCQLCNQGKGKRNRFPIEGVYAMSPDADLDAEKPLLLNPYGRAHWKAGVVHLEYEFKIISGDLCPTGRVRGISPQGKESVRVYDLNRRALVARRRRNQETALTAITFAFVKGNFERVYRAQFADHKEHATAIRAACRRWKEDHMAELQSLP